ncbi:MAG: phytoene/squalene synthase family protein [Methylovirgula sp.]
MSPAIAAAYDHCNALLKREDPDRWLAALFLPEAARPHIHALYAFNLEIARVRRLVSEPMLGEIRFQWWREVLAGERDGEADANPVAAALLDTLAARNLPSAPLQGLIEARLFDLYGQPMPSVAALEAYAKATAGQLFQLAAAVIDTSAGTEVSEAIAHAGIGYALTGLMRALPWHAATGQAFLPQDLLSKHGAVIEAAQVGLASPALLKALAELREIARGHLKAFAAWPGAKSGQAATVFLPVSLCDSYLRLMEKSRYAPFESMIWHAQWRRQLRLWWAARAIG